MLLSGLGSSLQINEKASWAPTFMSPLFSSQIQCDPPSWDQDFPAMMNCGVTCETNASFVSYVAFVRRFVSVVEVTDAWAFRLSFIMCHRCDNTLKAHRKRNVLVTILKKTGCQWHRSAEVLWSALHQHCQKTTNLNHIVYFWRSICSGWKLVSVVNILRVRDLGLKLLILPLVSRNSPGQYFEVRPSTWRLHSWKSLKR